MSNAGHRRRSYRSINISRSLDVILTDTKEVGRIKCNNIGKREAANGKGEVKRTCFSVVNSPIIYLSSSPTYREGGSTSALYSNWFTWLPSAEGSLFKNRFLSTHEKKGSLSTILFRGDSHTGHNREIFRPRRPCCKHVLSYWIGVVVDRPREWPPRRVLSSETVYLLAI